MFRILVVQRTVKLGLIRRQAVPIKQLQCSATVQHRHLKTQGSSQISQILEQQQSHVYNVGTEQFGESYSKSIEEKHGWRKEQRYKGVYGAVLFSFLAVYAREEKKVSATETEAIALKENNVSDPSGCKTASGGKPEEALTEDFKDKIAKEIAAQTMKEMKESKLKSDEESKLELEMEKFEVKTADVETRFEHVVGNDALISELKQIVKFVKDPETYLKMGATLPSGCLISGPHGVGKTHIARAMAGECGVLFYSTNAMDFADHSSGVERLRNLFKLAYSKKPCIIFIDDIDSLPKDCQDLLNHLMDGFHRMHGVFLLAATTDTGCPEGLARPGRFDIKSVLTEPDKQTRIKLIEMYVKNKEITLDRSVDTDKLAQETYSYTGSEIFGILNHATILAVGDGRNKVSQQDIHQAMEKLEGGLANAKLDKEAKIHTAYHEAGHAMVQHYIGVDSKKVKRLSIVPRGETLGSTHFVLGESRLHKCYRDEIVSDIDILMGGRVAEELIYGKDKVSTGASGDMIRATGKARRMVKSYGFSDTVGLRYIEESATVGDELQKQIDSEISRILEESYNRVKELLSENKSELKRLAEKLAEKEELSYEEMKDILDTSG